MRPTRVWTILLVVVISGGGRPTMAQVRAAASARPGGRPGAARFPDTTDESTYWHQLETAARYFSVPGAVAALLSAETVAEWTWIARAVCRRGDFDDAALLLAAGVLELGPVGGRGMPALMAAAGAGKLEMVELLLQAGADPGWAAADNGWTAVTVADAGEHRAVVQALVAAGGDPRSRLRHGRSPLMRAVRADPPDPGRVRDVLSRSPLLLEVRDDGPDTPLYAAAYRADESPERTEILTMLLTAGADPNARCGATQDLPAFDTLRQAAFSPNALRLLLDAGTWTHATDNRGWTLMHQAALWGDPATIGLLAERGVPVDTRDGDGVTPLLRSLEFAGTHMARALLALGADATATDRTGAGAFHWYAAHAHAGIHAPASLLRALLQGGADPTATDNDGRTPADAAAEIGHSS